MDLYLPWETFWMHMHSQVSAGFNKLFNICYPKCLLCCPHRFPFDGWSLLQDWWVCDFFINTKLFRSCTWWRLWGDQRVMHSPKVNEICNIPSYIKILYLLSFMSCPEQELPRAPPILVLPLTKQTLTIKFFHDSSLNMLAIINSWVHRNFYTPNTLLAHIAFGIIH